MTNIVKNNDCGGTSDPSRATIAAVIDLVPVSRWAFAHLGAGGKTGRIFGSNPERTEIEREYAFQRGKVRAGPRVAPMRGPLDTNESGITLIFADARQTFGILMLARTSDLGPFTSSEVSVLTLALDAISEQLAALRNCAYEKSVAGETNGEAIAGAPFYVLDDDLQIVLAFTAHRGSLVAPAAPQVGETRLPVALETTVRTLVSAWSKDPLTREPGSARPVPFLTLRTHSMSGPSGFFIGVRINRFQASSLAGHATRFRITSRELQVLTLLLDGTKVDDIGAGLHITSSTVQDHIRSMIDKTESRNRSELIARMLGWESRSQIA